MLAQAAEGLAGAAEDGGHAHVRRGKDHVREDVQDDVVVVLKVRALGVEVTAPPMRAHSNTPGKKQ